MAKTGFAARLSAVLDERGMNAADLARLAFNNRKRVDKYGRETVWGKEQMATYVSGRRFPSPARYKEIVEALKLTPEELPRVRNRGRPRRLADRDQLTLDLPVSNKSATNRELIEALNRLTDAVNKLTN